MVGHRPGGEKEAKRPMKVLGDRGKKTKETKRGRRCKCPRGKWRLYEEERSSETDNSLWEGGYWEKYLEKRDKSINKEESASLLTINVKLEGSRAPY